MIHHDLCNGLGMRVCYGCARNVEHYSLTTLAANRARLKPDARPPHCGDWLAMSRAATDASHTTL